MGTADRSPTLITRTAVPAVKLLFALAGQD